MRFDTMLAAVCPSDRELRNEAAIAFSHVERVTIENMLVGLKMPLMPTLSNIVADEDAGVLGLNLVFHAKDGISGDRELRVYITSGVVPEGWHTAG